MAAMVKCRACGTDISKAATACPKCGHPQPKRTSTFTWVVAAILGYAVLHAILTGPSRRAEEQRAQAAAQAAMTPAQRAEKQKRDEEAKLAAEAESRGYGAIAAARSAVTSSLKDPSSAQFREIGAYPFNGSSTLFVVCGEVNAKNSFGGYTGFTGFVWTPAGVSLRTPENDRKFVDAWNKYCAGKHAIASAQR